MSDINLSGLNSSYPSGSTAQRPEVSNIGALYFNTDLGVLQIYTVNGWFVYQNPANPISPTQVFAVNEPSGREFNNGQAVISFSPSTSGGVPTLFTVTPSPATIPATFTGTSSPIVVTGLQSSTQYTYTVTATNLTGSSSASLASNAVTATTFPQAPTISGILGSDGQLVVDFVANGTGGSSITSYTATATTGGNSFTVSGSSSPLTITGLTNGITYAITLIATNSIGNSLPANSSGDPLPPPPSGTVYRFDTTTASAGLPSGSYYLMIIGGGTAGQNGLQNAGNYPSTRAGAGGASGKVLNVGPVSITGGESVVIGDGGNMGSGNLAAGNAGGNSSFGNYNSSNGVSVSGGGPATNNSSPRNGGAGSASAKTTAPVVLSNNFGFSVNSTTGSGGGGGWNYAVGGSGGPGGGSWVASPLQAIGRGGEYSGGAGGDAFNANAANIIAKGYGAGGGGGQGGGNGNSYAPPGGAGSGGVIYVIKA